MCPKILPETWAGASAVQGGCCFLKRLKTGAHRGMSARAGGNGPHQERKMSHRQRGHKIKHPASRLYCERPSCALMSESPRGCSSQVLTPPQRPPALSASLLEFGRFWFQSEGKHAQSLNFIVGCCPGGTKKTDMPVILRMISKLTLKQSDLVFFEILFKRHKSRSTDYIKGSS